MNVLLIFFLLLQRRYNAIKSGKQNNATNKNCLNFISKQLKCYKSESRLCFKAIPLCKEVIIDILLDISPSYFKAPWFRFTCFNYYNIFHCFILYEDLIAVEHGKTQLLLNRPIYCGFAVLELSKVSLQVSVSVPLRFYEAKISFTTVIAVVYRHRLVGF